MHHLHSLEIPMDRETCAQCGAPTDCNDAHYLDHAHGVCLCSPKCADKWRETHPVEPMTWDSDIPL